jgi:hypothetical protein
VRLLRYEPVPDEEEVSTAGQAPPEQAEPEEDPVTDREITIAVTRILQVGLEVLDGRRPVGHLVHHLGPAALRYWRAAAGTAPLRHGASRLHRVVVGRPRSGVAEVAAVCVVRGRIRALAARFEASGEARAPWRCTVLRLG